jgi:hypothetical protein
MALFTDGTISKLEDLCRYDSAILDVASTENIDVAAKLALAQKQIEVELMGLLHSRDLGNVVVTEELRQWHARLALRLVYADAYYRQLNDRYSAKLTLYRDLANEAAGALLAFGIGSVHDPIGRAGAPELAYLPGPLAAATYYVRATWTNGGGQEGSPSDAAVLSAPDGHVLVARAAAAPTGVMGWNVYAGLSPDGTTLQYEPPLAVAEAWTEPVSGLRNGAKPGNGQEPGYYRTIRRILQRG